MTGFAFYRLEVRPEVPFGKASEWGVGSGKSDMGALGEDSSS